MTAPSNVHIEDLTIELTDGTRLAARRWWTGDEEQPRPTIFEHLPYRLSDFRAGRDNSWFGPLAAAGYVGLRVDIRGTGNSDGTFQDEYSAQELEDAEEILQWIRSQSWSDGLVGMVGISYSGINALHLAARNPPGLRAVISAGFTDDRFEQDVHRIGGAVHDQGLSWAQMCLGIIAMPPDPLLVGDDKWLPAWEQRLDSLEPPILTWLEHQWKDSYWSQDSVRDKYDQMTCAVYGVSGWNDRYRDGVLSLMTNYQGPRKGLIGPWEHAWPHEAGIGPQLDFIPEAIRWFDYWLKGVENGIADEPILRTWIEDSAPPSPAFQEQSGRWVEVEAWPSEAVEEHQWYASSGGLSMTPSHLEQNTPISSDSLVGLEGGVSAPFKSAATDLARDQRGEDGRSTSFDSAQLTEAIDILGQVRLTAVLTSDVPLATLSARICDVFPDGTSRLISQGMLNLAMRDSFEHPTELPAHEPVPVEIMFQGIGYQIPPEHRLRLSLSTNYWPWMWPSPQTPHLQAVEGTDLIVHLPQLNSRAALSSSEPHRPEVETRGSIEGTWRAMANPDANRTDIHFDLGTGHFTRDAVSNVSTQPFRSQGASLEFEITAHDEITEGDPLSTVSVMSVHESLGRHDWQISIESSTRITCDADYFHVDVTLDALSGEELVRSLHWERRIPRDLI